MTIHAKMDCTDGRGKWLTTCSCGWTKAAATSREEHANYIVHIEDALGPAAYYTAGVGSTNCGTEATQSVPVGIRVMSEHNRCGSCGCAASLVPRNEIAEDYAQDQR